MYSKWETSRKGISNSSEKELGEVKFFSLVSMNYYEVD
jgi:hypothetical protein